MNEIASHYIYQNSLLVEVALLIYVLAFLGSPQHLTALVAALLLLRPNERFQCYLPYPKLSLVILFIMILTHASALGVTCRPREIRLILWFIFLVLLEILFVDPAMFLSTLFFLASGTLLFLAVLIFMDDEKGFRILAYVIAFSCIVVCLEPLYYHYTEEQGSQLWKLFHFNGRLQAWGMWGNANETAFLACVGMVSFLAILLRYRSAFHFLLAAAVLPLFAWTVFLTGSRAGLMCLFILFLPGVLFMKSKAAKIVIIAACSGAFLVSLSTTPARTDAAASSIERSDLRYEGRQMFLHNPLVGVGFGKAATMTDGHLLHNTYLQAFAETGLAGGMLFLCYLGSLGKRLYGSLKKERGTPEETTVVALSGLYLTTVFYLYWGNQLLSVMFFLITGLITCYLNQLAAKEGSIREEPASEPLAPGDERWAPGRD